MLVAVLQAHGLRVFTNPSTANIRQGLTSALLESSNLRGEVDADIAVLEMDEGHGARLATTLAPTTVVLTNVMTDQIDRFEDSEKVAALLSHIALSAAANLVINADDQFLCDLATQVTVPVSRFGVTKDVRAGLKRGLGYAREATTGLDAPSDIRVSQTQGRQADIRIFGATYRVGLPAKGAHYAVDAAAATAAARVILGAKFDAQVCSDALSGVQPVFGRGEIVTVHGKSVECLLVQNPASFQLNLDTLDVPVQQVLLAMGSDVRDPSYFWPVDPSALGRVTTVTGSKAHEMALHLGYYGVVIDSVNPNLGEALDAFLDLPEPEKGIKTVIFTADAMRKTRAHWELTS